MDQAGVLPDSEIASPADQTFGRGHHPIGRSTLEGGGMHRISLNEVLVADSPRSLPLDEEHAHVLAVIDAPLPPILVHRQTMHVIDGAHRLAAAKLRGDALIDVRFFDGTDHEAFVEGVRSNVRHGKPLSLGEREAAAKRILCASPDLSDRFIADACGLSGKTVGAIRRRASADIPHSNARLGRDGRVRPVDLTVQKQRVADALVADPKASLRSVAATVGVSPATVRDVRTRMARPGRVNPQRLEAIVVPITDSNAIDEEIDRLSTDSALSSSEECRALVQWLAQHVVKRADWYMFVDAVPLSRVYDVADLARSLAASWTEFAQRLEARSKGKAAN